MNNRTMNTTVRRQAEAFNIISLLSTLILLTAALATAQRAEFSNRLDQGESHCPA
jgi:hypothetical protein